MKEDPITARIILEIVGAPKEHIEDALEQTIKKFENEDKIKILKSKTFESKKLDNGFWSAFAEIEFKADNIQEVLDVCFDYTPSSLEILEPAGLEVDTAYLASLFNDLLAKIHQFVAIIKNLEAERYLLKQELDKLKK
jgi:translation elongation factor EF-G